MHLKEAIRVLSGHNEYRRGGSIEIQSPEQIGNAIDFAIKFMSQFVQKERKPHLDPDDCEYCGNRYCAGSCFDE